MDLELKIYKRLYRIQGEMLTAILRRVHKAAAINDLIEIKQILQGIDQERDWDAAGIRSNRDYIEFNLLRNLLESDS